MTDRLRIAFRAVAAAAALACASCGAGTSQSCVDRVANFAPTALNLTADASALLVTGASLVSYCGDDPGPRSLFFKFDLAGYSLCSLTALPSDAQSAPPLPPPAACACTLAYAYNSGGKSLRVYVSKTPDQAKKEIAVVDVSGPTPKAVAAAGVFDGVRACP